MSRRRSIPWLIILIGTGFLALSAWSIYLAAHRASPVTDVDYYDHGLRFNQTLLEQRAAASLGWEIVPSLQGRRVTFLLRDRGKNSVSGATGSLAVLGSGQPAIHRLPLNEQVHGTYQAELPAGLRGEHPVEVTFVRGDARLHKRLLFSLD